MQSAPEFLRGSRIANKHNAAVGSSGNREEIQGAPEEGAKGIKHRDDTAAVSVKPEPKTEASLITSSAEKEKLDFKMELQRQKQQLINNDNW